MSKYDDLNFKSFSELNASSLSSSSCQIKATKPIKEKEALSHLDNIPISSIKEMINLSPIESNYFDYINNNQQCITKDYYTKCNLFSNCNTQQKRINFFIDMMTKQYGTIINSKVLQQFIESFNNDKSNKKQQQPQLTLRDYERLIMLNCCKDNLNLNNEHDTKLFLDLLLTLFN